MAAATAYAATAAAAAAAICTRYHRVANGATNGAANRKDTHRSSRRRNHRSRRCNHRSRRCAEHRRGRQRAERPATLLPDALLPTALLPAAALPAATAALPCPHSAFDSRAARLRLPSAPLLGLLAPLEADTATESAPQRARMAEGNHKRAC